MPAVMGLLKGEYRRGGGGLHGCILPQRSKLAQTITIYGMLAIIKDQKMLR